MDKIKIFLIAIVFVFVNLFSMPRGYLDDCQKAVDNISSMSHEANDYGHYAEVAMVSLGVADFIRLYFLNSREFRGDVEQKIDFVKAVLDFYKKTHEIFILNRHGCPPEWFPTEVLEQYFLCGESLQEEFQKKVADIFGGCELSILQWFDEMRDFEYQLRLIPSGLI